VPDSSDFEISIDAPDARPTAPEPGVPRHWPAMCLDTSPDTETYAPLPDAAPTLARILFIPDVHRPYHDKAAWALMLRAAREFKPDKIVILGDFADFYSVSSFDKHPKRVSDLKTEAEDANVGLDELDALGAGYKVFIKGNHEDRLERYLCKSAPALFGCVSVNDLFHLAERGWNAVEYKRSTRLGKLRLTHDTGTAGINAHRQSVDAFQAPVIIGHTHRMEMSFRGNSDGSPTVGAMFGWLGDFDAIDYMQAVKARRDWVHGFGIGFQEPSGVVHLQPVPIINGRCVVAGKLIV
jgi:predicted phosphodiesterase